MKILMINDIGSEFAGAETVIQNTSKELRRKGHTVKILSGNEYYSEKRINDFEFKSFSDKSFLRLIFYIFNPYSFLKLKKILNDYQPDVIHIHNNRKASSSILFLLKKYPTILSIHDYMLIDPTHISNNKLLAKYKKYFKGYYVSKKIFIRFYWEKVRFLIFKMLINNIDIFVFCSDYIKNVYLSEYSTINSITIYNGVYINKYTPYSQNNTKSIMYIGRLEEKKGIFYLLKSFENINNIDSNIKLTIVSSGKYDKNIKELIVHHRLKKNIKLFFNIPHYDINKYYRQSSIVVVPSLWPEPLGMVGLEAMRNGIPVIATKVGGIPEWLNDGKTGFLIEPKNQKQIAEKVIILFKDKELMNRMSIEAKNKVKKFSIEKQVERLEEVYISTIEKYIN